MPQMRQPVLSSCIISQHAARQPLRTVPPDQVQLSGQPYNLLVTCRKDLDDIGGDYSSDQYLRDFDRQEHAAAFNEVMHVHSNADPTEHNLMLAGGWSTLGASPPMCALLLQAI